MNDQDLDQTLVDDEGNELDLNDVGDDELIERDVHDEVLGPTKYTASCMMTDPDLLPFAPQEPDVPRPAARLGMKSFRSGPKGVRADFEESKLKMRARRVQENILKEDKIKRLAIGQDTAAHIAPSQSLHEALSEMHTARLKKVRRQNDEDSDECSDLESDDEITIARKQEIYLELHNVMNRYGQVMEIVQASFLEAIDSEPANVLIVIVIYQDYQERCQRFLHGIEKVASAAPHIKFCQGRADKVLEKINDNWLPLVYFYRNKKELKLISHAAHQLPQGFTDAHVAAFIERYLVEYGERPIQKLVAAYQAMEKENDDANPRSVTVVENDGDDSDGALDID